ncbi:energy transducer TonB [Aquiflexum lacus]|uniref:energy transducer TonB n=1 Tax=Aquiflexum lacus TaxID=2483805 RepID=UPI0018944611|nr:energy transducer TonB [Aquiflexum lacus]
MKKTFFITLIFLSLHHTSFSQKKIALDKDFNELTGDSSRVFYRVNPFGNKELSFILLDSMETKIGSEEWTIDKFSGALSERKIQLFNSEGTIHQSLLIKEKNREITYYHDNGKKKCVEKYETGMISSRVNYDDNGVFESSDKIVKPEAVGGLQAWNKHLISKLRYPREAFKAKAVGLVLVGFDVFEDGEIKNVKIINKGENHPALEDEAKRVVELFDKGWTPLTINGIPQKSQMTIPINFVRG